MRHVRAFSPRLPYLVVIALLVGLLASDVFANRYDNAGVPADLMRELNAIQDQVDGVQGTVDNLQAYIENETAATGEAYAELCFNASLAVMADGSIGVEGLAEVGVATGVDIYGLLDIQAGVAAEAQVNLEAMLEAGIDLTATICLNAGIANTTSVAIPLNDELELPDGLDEVIASTREIMAGIYDELPTLFSDLPVGVGDIDSGINTLLAAASDPGDFSVTALYDRNAWLDAIEGLPGASALAARYDAVEDAFSTLGDGDVCAFFAGAAGAIDGDLEGVTSTVCNAVPAGISTGIDFAETAVDTVWGLVQNVERVTFLVDEVIEGTVLAINTTVNGINTVVNAIKGVVDSIDGVVDDVCDVLGC